MNLFEPRTSYQFRAVNQFASHTISPKKILFLTYRFPYPLSGGDRLKSYHLLRHLSSISDVDLIALDEWGSATHENLQHIKKFASTVTVVPFSKNVAIKNVALSLLSRTPAEMAWYYSAQMQEVVDLALASKRYDLVVCFFVRTAEYVKNFTDAPKLLIAEDSRLLADERGSEKFSFSADYFVRKMDAIKLRKYEPQIASQFDLVTFVAESDRARILQEDPTLRTNILTNGVDIDTYKFFEGQKANTILFAGHLGIYHNRLMAERILTRIFPMIRMHSPDTNLVIAGKDPSPALAKLVAETAGASLHGNVEALIPYYQSAKLFIHPQEVGAGIQNKLLECMALGTPVITTEIGASGVDGVINHQHLIVCDTDVEFAEAAISLLGDSPEQHRLARNARNLIEQRYTWDTIFAVLDELIGGIIPDYFVKSSTEEKKRRTNDSY
ncbi:MAG: glycosyltransferase [bacterium]